jgi:hypothetical protein
MRPRKSGSPSSNGEWGNRLPRATLALACVFGAAVTNTLGAQGSPRTQVRCSGQIITDVAIRTHAPDYGGFLLRAPGFERAVDALHTTTAPEVVRNFVLLKKGEPCSPLQRYETERILRAQPFLAQANVTAFADGGDGVRIEVVTVDEPSVIAAVGIQRRSPPLHRLTLGSANLGGQGVHASASWRDGGELRSQFGARYSNYQLFGQPYQLHLNGSRRERGSDWSASVLLPFLTDVQGSAWRVGVSRALDFVPYRRDSAFAAGVGVDRTLGDVGAIARLGRPGRLALLGISATVERARVRGTPVTLGEQGEIPDSTPSLIDAFESYRTARVNLLLGLRGVRFMRVQRFDALNAEQDVRKGAQVGVALGRSLPFAQWDDDIYTSVGFYVGGGSPNSFAAFEGGAEGRRPLSGGDDDWNAMYMGGRAATYFRPHNRHTITTSAEWSAAYRPRLPVQLSLADRRFGVRSYRQSNEGGARRLVLRSEERWYFGDVRGSADIGVTAFAETGRLWLGDAALGTNTGWRPAIGAGFVTAIPRRSQRLWRAEFAVPLASGAGGKFEIRLSSADMTTRWWVEPHDLRRSGRRTVLGDLFNWP